MAKQDDEEQAAGKHNLRSQSKKGWKLEAWTSATLYDPGEPIDITLRLTNEGGKAVESAEGILFVKIAKSGSEFSRDVKLVVPSLRMRQQQPEWEKTFHNVFKAPEKENSAIVIPGHYLIDIKLALGEEMEFEFKDIPIKVFRMIGH